MEIVTETKRDRETKEKGYFNYTTITYIKATPTLNQYMYIHVLTLYSWLQCQYYQEIHTDLLYKFSSLTCVQNHAYITWQPRDLPTTPTNYLPNNSFGFCSVFPTSESLLDEGVAFNCHGNGDVLHSKATKNPPVFWRWGKTLILRESRREWRESERSSYHLCKW